MKIPGLILLIAMSVHVHAMEYSDNNIIKIIKNDNRELLPSLIRAIDAGNIKELEQICSTNKNSLEARPIISKTALTYAFDVKDQRKNKEEICKILLEYSADVNIKIKVGGTYTRRNQIIQHYTTPLHIAVENKWSDVVQLLLLQGHAVDAADLCAITSRESAFARFCQRLCKDTPALDKKTIAICKLLIEHGAVVKKEWLLKFTNNPEIIHSIIITACNNNDLNIVEEYLTELSGMTKIINHQDENGNTILHNLSNASSYELLSTKLELLLKAGADPNIINKQGFAPLNLVAQKFLQLQQNILQLKRNING